MENFHICRVRNRSKTFNYGKFKHTYKGAKDCHHFRRQEGSLETKIRAAIMFVQHFAEGVSML